VQLQTLFWLFFNGGFEVVAPSLLSGLSSCRFIVDIDTFFTCSLQHLHNALLLL
jgi:hypothetical protein